MEAHAVDNYEVRIWKAAAEIEQIEYATYWNNEAEERKKEWWTLDGDFVRMDAYLEQSYLAPQFRQVVDFLKQRLGMPLRGCGADLAAGNLWATCHLLQVGAIERIYAVEMSQHRLLQLGPQILERYQVPHEKVVLCLGSFYELQIPDCSLDFVFLSQAFHHADDPLALLGEIRRVLKPGGVVLIIGEHMIDAVAIRARAYVRYLLECGIARIRGTQRTAPVRRPFAPDPVLGDHFYRAREYRTMFLQCGFTYHSLHLKRSGFQSFVLVRNAR